MSIKIIGLIVTLIIIGFVLNLIAKLDIHAFIKYAIIGISLICTLIYVLQFFGLLTGFPRLRA